MIPDDIMPQYLKALPGQCKHQPSRECEGISSFCSVVCLSCFIASTWHPIELTSKYMKKEKWLVSWDLLWEQSRQGFWCFSKWWAILDPERAKSGFEETGLLSFLDNLPSYILCMYVCIHIYIYTFWESNVETPGWRSLSLVFTSKNMYQV